ncbi:MAG: hypothetical protein KJS92_10730 [Bacteroidetes bacterium]|nr:hypothetical protein [Bacteroidota bacterium]
MLLLAFAASLFSLASCKDDHNHDEGEVITTVQLLLSDSATGAPFGDFRFEDQDGPGGNNPSRLDTIYLDSGKVTDVSLRFADVSSGTSKDITAEIRAEGDEHIVCFKPAGVQLGVTATDTDGKYPIGLETRWKAGAKGSGSITVVLKHQPGSKNGSCDPGDTDVEVVFPVQIR